MKKFWDNFEEILCAFALVIMAIITFINVFSRKVSFINLSFTQELVTTMFVWVCCLAAAAAFKTNSHMGFSYLTDKLTGPIKTTHTYVRAILITVNYLIWLYYGAEMVWRQAHYNMLTGVLEMPIWMIGIAIPLSAVLSIYLISSTCFMDAETVFEMLAVSQFTLRCMPPLISLRTSAFSNSSRALCAPRAARISLIPSRPLI